MPLLNIYAGAKALAMLQQSSFHPHLFTQFLGASGGPKWFVLAGLDKALFGDFFNQYSGQMNIIGSSSGAFRAACFAQENPEQAIDDLALHYAKTVYSKNPSAYEISEKAKELVSVVLNPKGIVDLMNHDSFTIHVIAVRCKHLMKSYGKTSQLLGLLGSAAANTLSRKNLKYFYDRIIFSSRSGQLKVRDPYDIPTEYIKMGHNTVASAVLASGSIPLFMEGTRDIVCAPTGIYRDGGIVDYHFDLDFVAPKGLTLYPHFYPHVTPGWFDKHNGRAPHQANYDNVVMLVPSAEFLASLPEQRIPDRKDFERLDDHTRIKNWTNVIHESERLGDYFLELVTQKRIAEVVQPLPFNMIQ